MAPAWLAAYLVDLVLLAALGVLDYLRGEAPGELTVACYASALLVYPLLPAPLAYKAALFAAHLALAATIAAMYYRGGVGLMDLVIAPNLPLLLANPGRVEHLAAGAVGGVAALLAHIARVRGRCGGRLVPGGVVTVSGEEAYRRWYYFPLGVHAEIPGEELERIKRRWRSRKCVKARLVVPLVWVYSVSHIAATLAWMTGYIHAT